MAKRSQPDDKPLPVLDGMVRLEAHTMKRLLLGKGWTLREFCKATDTQMRTAKKVFAGERIQISKARQVAEVFGAGMLDIVDPDDYTPPSLTADSRPELGTGEWVVGNALTPVITTANKLQYRVFAMNHAYEPSRRGRGKRYEFHEQSDEDKAKLRHAMCRHLAVCERIAPHPQFPTCYATFPDANRDTWWVIDQWIDGETLASRLDRGPLKSPKLESVGRQIAEAILAAHNAEIILRELTPDAVLLSADDDNVVLTDFELAKLTEDYPTVSIADWPPNPYRAPEVGAGKTTPLVDVYSWGRLMTHLVLGKIPAPGQELSELKFSTAPRELIELLGLTVQLQPAKRPKSIGAVVDAMESIS